MGSRPIAKRTRLAATGLAAAALLASCGQQSRRQVAWPALGRQATLDLHAGTERIADVTEAEIRLAYERARRALSLDADSELVRLNASAGSEPYSVQDPDLYRCIVRALDWARASGGAYDPTMGALLGAHGGGTEPTDETIARALERTGWSRVILYPEAEAVRFRVEGMGIDLRGILHGYALDMGARAFARSGVHGALMAIGPSRYAWGAPPGSETWLVPIGEARGEAPALGSVALAHRGLGVAGSLERTLGEDAAPPPDLLDAVTGRPPETDVVVAVAIADTAAGAEAIAHALYVMGSQRAGEFLQRTRRVEALLVVQGNAGPSLLASGSLAGRLQIDPRFAARLGEPRHLLPPTSIR